MYRCVNSALIYFVRFYEYAVSPNGLFLTQSKVDPCTFLQKSEKGKPKIILIYYVDDFFYYGKTQTCGKIQKRLCKEFGIVEDGQLEKLLGVRYKCQKCDLG